MQLRNDLEAWQREANDCNRRARLVEQQKDEVNSIYSEF